MPRRTKSADRGVCNAPQILAPLSFEEALRDLLQVAPPPKDEQPEPARGPPKRGRKKKQADEKGSQ